MLLAVPHRHDQGTARQNTKGVRLPKNKMNNNTAVKLLRRGVTLVPPPHTSPSLTGCSLGSGTHVFPSRALAVRAALRPACRRSARAITAPDGIHLSWRKRGLDGDGRPQIAHRHAPQAWHGGHCCRCWGGSPPSSARGFPSGLYHFPPPQLEAPRAATPTLLQPSFGLDGVHRPDTMLFEVQI